MNQIKAYEEKPIIYSTPMVQAILEGRKTKTRRVCHRNFETLEEVIPVPRVLGMEEYLGKYRFTWESGDDAIIKCPYGQPGDILWVRESFAKIGMTEIFSGRKSESYVYKAGRMVISSKTNSVESIVNGTAVSEISHGFDHNPTGKWKPPIFMPKEACRILLKITDVRVELLQDISEPDAKAEGVLFDTLFKSYICYQCDKGHIGADNLCENGFFSTAKKSFQSLWKSIYGIESWNSNPWVWVITFEKNN